MTDQGENTAGARRPRRWWQFGLRGQMQHLHGMSQLRLLNLGHTQVTDAGLESVEALAQLERLWLQGTKITDKGLERLKRLSQLQTLVLYGSPVTAAGIADLKQALPNCRIDGP